MVVQFLACRDGVPRWPTRRLQIAREILHPVQRKCQGTPHHARQYQRFALRQRLFEQGPRVESAADAYAAKHAAGCAETVRFDLPWGYTCAAYGVRNRCQRIALRMHLLAQHNIGSRTASRAVSMRGVPAARAATAYLLLRSSQALIATTSCSVSRPTADLRRSVDMM